MVSIFLTIPKNKPQETALSLTPPDGNSNGNSKSTNPTVITNHQLLQAKNKGRVQISNQIFITVYPSFRNAPKQEKLPIHALLTLTIPAATLLSALIAFRVSGATGWESIFPSQKTCPIVLKLTVWIVLVAVVAYEQSFYHYSSSGKHVALEGEMSDIYVGLEVIIDDGFLVAQVEEYHEDVGVDRSGSWPSIALNSSIAEVDEDGNGEIGHVDGNDNYLDQCMEDPSQDLLQGSENDNENGAGGKDDSVPAAGSKRSSPSVPRNKSNPDPPDATGKSVSVSQSRSSVPPITSSLPSPSIAKKSVSVSVASTPKTTSTKTTASPGASQINAPGSIPFRFIRATKGDVVAAKVRWADTCTWREENSMDLCLSKPHPNLKFIKQYYPHYFHMRGKNNECCYYEQPPKMNLPELKRNGITIEKLIKHYAICCEYMWTKIEDSEEGKSIYVIDLDGIGFRDFAGEVVDFVKRASSFTGAHYPERSGTIFVINVPSWFSVIWNVVKPMVDDVTKQKIKILRYGKEAITKALMEKIDIENIPPEYGGKSAPLGQSPEELSFMKHFETLNQNANQNQLQG